MSEDFWVFRALNANDDQLYEDLARYCIGTDFARELVNSGAIDGQEAVGFDSSKELGLLGRKVFSRISHQCFELFCGEGTKDQDDLRGKLLDSLGISDVATIGLLTQMMITNLHVGAPLAAAASALILRAILKPMTGGVCDYWKTKL